MSLIKLQQSQMSGSLAFDDNLNVGGSDYLEKPTRTLIDDLNALRTQIKNIQGTDAWTSPLSGSQSLSEIEAAMKVDGTTVDFEGDVYVADDAFVSGSLEVAETVKALAGFSGSLTKLADGSDYILAGKNITTITGAAGNIEIIANPDDVVNGVQYNVDGYFTANEKFTFTMATDDGNNPMGKLVMSGTFVQGNNSIAIGEYSHAAGYETQAIGPRSQALGTSTVAGYFSIQGANIDANGDLVLQKADLSGLTTPITAYVADGAYYEPVQITIISITLDGEDSILSIEGGASIPAGAGVDLIFDASDVAGLEQVAATQTGTGAASRGNSTRAWGDSSSARGNGTKALGAASHAEGNGTDALGDYSHAEGNSARAHGESSHAEGHQAKTGAADHLNLWSGGQYAHAEGSNTRAYGEASHAEGNLTFAIGVKSHAEGSATFAGGFEIPAEVSGDSLKFTGDVAYRLQASNNNSVLFVIGTEAIALTLLVGTQVYDEETDSTTISVAENTSLVEASGYVISTESIWIGHVNASVVGDYSHAEGLDARALGDYSHAEGVSSYALGQNSHAEGINTTTTGFGSHAEGEFSVAKGNGSHAEGYMTIGYANHSHAEGESTLASGVASHAEGHMTTGSANYSHSEGRFSLASGQYSHAEGDLTTAGGVGSHAEGSGSLAMGVAAHAEGFLTSAPANYSHAEGWAVIASGSWSHAEGKATITSGSWSHAEGIFSIARGEGSHAEGSGSLATGVGSHAEGKDTTALGDFSHAGGLASLASGYASTAIGFGAVAAGNYSFAAGEYVVASGSAQTVFGKWNNENNSDSLFIIGGGTDDENRKDMFLVGPNSVMVGSASLAADTFFHVATSGGADKAKFDGSVLVDGFVKSENGFSGSLTKLADGTSYMIAGVGIQIVSASNGAITISANSNSTIKNYFAGDSGYFDGDTFKFGPGFANMGTLSVASDEFIDVYLNGVFLTYGSGKDIETITSTSFTLNPSIKSSLNSTDIISVVLRNLA